ncbi:acyltransferase [Amycolatopsis coloradensis]|uniref:Acyltransferase n=1 Tax=Amycolatopsis coloradensis TaxID=76021 RepID=A0ACD5BA97_9PSEU
MSDSNGDRARLVPVSPGSGSATTQPSKTLDSLTGIRFVAALMTFLFHITVLVNPLDFSWPAISPFADTGLAESIYWFFGYSGYIGLSFFFVLSGFVITWSAKPGTSARAFIRRRLVKVFPNHLVMWAAVMLLFAGGVVSWQVWLPNLFLVQSWFPTYTISQSMNVPAWSLCAELLFYLSFPFLVKPLFRLSSRGLWIGAAAMVVGLGLYQLAVSTFIPGPAAGSGVPMSDTQYWLAYLFPVGRIFEFLLGMFLARIVITGQWPARLGPLVATLIMAVGYAATLFVPVQLALNLITLAPIGIVVAAFANADLRGTRTLVRGKRMVFLGKISFGFYMCQAVTVFYFRAVTGGPKYDLAGALLLSLGMFAMTLLGGWLLFRFVETPMMRRFGRKPGEPAAPVQPRGADLKSPDASEERSAA